ncbi:MAG: hypothetical protein JWO32_303 [Bacteroidetes bacterium]|nr:hypothetical protein [Bacteroidota bacterium]
MVLSLLKRFSMKNIFLLFIGLVNYSFSQNFPYLNASTGNPNFFTDKDTNMFIIHGNRIAKVDKNFNPVWVNTYGGLTFKRILLSKTGSMYFIAAQTPTSYLVGKIEANGNAGWMKSTTSISVAVAGSTINSASLEPGNMFLDSNNNLLFATTTTGPGNTGVVTLDTLGNFVKARTFLVSDYTSNSGGSVLSCYVLNEAAGILNLVTMGNIVGGAFGGMRNISYSNTGDSVVSIVSVDLGGATNTTSTHRYTFFKSKMRADLYFLFGEYEISQPSPSATPYRFVLGRFTMNSMLWSKGWRWTGAFGMGAAGLDEDEKGNIFGVVNTLNSASSAHSGFVKFDSTGAFNGNWIKYFNGFNPNSNSYPDDRVNVIHYNRYFLNVAGNGYPTNPLTIEPVSAALTMSCAPSVSLAQLTSPLGIGGTTQKPTQYTVTSMSMANVTPTVNPVTNFSVVSNFCATVGFFENELNNDLFVYPNPTNGIIKVYGEQNNSAELYDINGRMISHSMNLIKEIQMDLSKLPAGIYILKSGTMVKKIVKEN